MNTTFKKTLVASAILAFAGSANAAITKQVDGTLFSQQGIGASVAAGTVHIVLKAEYAVGDTLTVRFPGAAFHSSSSPSLAGLAAGAPTDTIANALTNPPGSITAAAATGLTFGLLSASGDTLTFRVTALDKVATPTTVNSVIALSGVVFTGASVLAAKDVGVVYSAQTSTGLAIDTATTNTGKVLSAKDQFALNVGTKADAVIDVSSDRKLFSTVGGADARVDVLAFTTTSTADTGFVTADKITYTVAGDFSWVDQDGNGTVSTAELEAAIGGLSVATDKLAIAADRQSISFEKAAVGAVSINLTTSAAAPATSKVVLNPTDFKVTAKIDYPASKSSVYNADGGSWSLNGSQVRVPYMVVGGGRFGVIANVTNHGSKSGSMVLDVFAEDGSVIASNFPAGTSEPGSVKSVASALNNALAAKGISTASPVKFSFQITTNVPANDVIVYTAYTDNTTSERAIVNNDSKVQTK